MFISKILHAEYAQRMSKTFDIHHAPLWKRFRIQTDSATAVGQHKGALSIFSTKRIKLCSKQTLADRTGLYAWTVGNSTTTNLRVYAMPIRINKAKKVILQTSETVLITKSHSTTPFTFKNKDVLNKIRPTSKTFHQKRKARLKTGLYQKESSPQNRKIPHSLECGIYKRVIYPENWTKQK